MADSKPPSDRDEQELQPRDASPKEEAGLLDPKPPTEGSEPQNEKWYERTRYQILLFAGGIALFVLLGGLILDWYIEPRTSGQKKDLVQALGLITAGVAAAVGIYFTWRGQRQAREAQENNQKNTLEQLEQSRNELAVHREGQITDRFTRAIDQLGKVDDKGNKLFEIRLGGIYALERIARESEEDHWPIMEVLTAYVRQHAPWRPEEGQEGTEDPAVEKEKPEKDSREKFETTEVSPLDPAIQAIMTVLARRTRSYGHGEPEGLALYRTNLPRANLPRANLPRANLLGANLSGANLLQANLTDALLRDALLRGALLWGTNLSGANFSGANLSGASLSDANLSGASLSDANLSDASLSDANLTGADLWGANLSGAELTQEQLEETIGNETIQLPPDLKRPAHWA